MATDPVAHSFGHRSLDLQCILVEAHFARRRLCLPERPAASAGASDGEKLARCIPPSAHGEPEIASL